MKNKLPSLIISGALGTVSLPASAALTVGTLLEFTGTFSMDTTAGLVVTPIKSGPDGGIIIGLVQDTNGHASHGGTTSHLAGGIDYEWSFFGKQGMHFTTSPIVVVDNDVNNDGGFTKTLDFSGWRVTWNGGPVINMGGGIQDCGTSSDGICSSSYGDLAGSYDNGTGLATITCSTASCSYSSSFTLSYNADVPMQSPPGDFGGVSYGLNLTGYINAVPIPAAAWLFSSGLAGLLLQSRRRWRR